MPQTKSWKMNYWKNTRILHLITTFAAIQWDRSSLHHHSVEWSSSLEQVQTHCFVILMVQRTLVVDGEHFWLMKELVRFSFYLTINQSTSKKKKIPFSKSKRSLNSISAFRIAHKAVKIVFDHEDKLVLSPYDTSATWEQIKKHFNIETRCDLLDHCYAKFDKAYFASLCEKLSHLASAGDKLCLHIFKDAGIFLAKATMALLPNVSDKLLTKNNLNIVCVGSVWKSWSLLQDGFKTEISKATNKFGLNLITLTQAMAIGAAYLVNIMKITSFNKLFGKKINLIHC